MLEILTDALNDSLTIFPFLFLVYILMEIIEGAKNKEKIEASLSGRFAPVMAAATGVVPECGFSVMCAKFFDGGLITLGTLIAAFIATSDEGLVILLSEGGNEKYVALALGIKIVYGALCGIIINILFKKYDRKHFCRSQDFCGECGEHHGGFFDKFIAHPFNHAAKIFFYILAVNVILSCVFYFIPEEDLYSFMTATKPLEPVFCAAFGLIPNCASSIVLAKGFSGGLISFAGLMAGLSANSGLGILVILRGKKGIKTGIFILLLTFILGTLCGYIFYPMSL